MAKGPENKAQGTSFEDIFFKQAQLQGFLVLKNHIACRFIPGGRAIVIKSELDFKLITAKGLIGYFDCKCYKENFFTYSMIDKEQIERSKLYSEWSVPSGFVVYFMKNNSVCFFTGKIIDKKGPGSRFESKDGLFLGSIFNFNLKYLMKN